MAMNRRKFLLGVPAAAAAVAAVGCSASLRKGSNDEYRELGKSESGGSKGTILVCMPETTQTNQVWTGLRDELAHDYRLIALRIAGRSGRRWIEEGVKRYSPSGVVLMNNPTVAAYRDFQLERKNDKFPPAIVVMSSFLDQRSLSLSQATGISYEVPLITVVTNLRKLLEGSIERIGVVHRPELRGFVGRQAALAAREQISVVTEEVSTQANYSELKRAIRRLKQRAGAIWVLNDDHLLGQQLIADGWLPGLNERPWVPTIVGAASLVSPQQSFGTFAVLPDHTALGVQTANMVFDLADNDWSLPANVQTELPLSTTTTLDLVQVRERFVLRADALKQVDRILDK